jgi:hypothetical protein
MNTQRDLDLDESPHSSMRMMGIRGFPVWLTRVLVPAKEIGLLTGQVAI